ncbi:MAG: ArsR family transcriptional regulator [Euryarchaeota archaeon]|nr:ArsR family transcriptional regulator [Euryarchaeota archaeon]MBT4407684.1 ArsR family transcriptional regulator [Euryarchaeota archaeon]
MDSLYLLIDNDKHFVSPWLAGVLIGMRAIRIDCNLENLRDDPRLKAALEYLSWDFRGVIDQENGDLLIMVECISIAKPPPPPGLCIGGITVEAILEQWEEMSLNHSLLVLRFAKNVGGTYFTSHDLALLAGTNLTANGLVVQITGSKPSIMRLLKDMRNALSIRGVTSAQGAKGIMAEGPNLEGYKVLKEAHVQGWYKKPKKTSVRQLAKILGISKSSVSNHLVEAENKVIGIFLEGE